MKTKLAVIGAVLVALGLAFAGWSLLTTPRNVNHLPQPRTVYEMKPASTNEWMQALTYDANDVLVQSKVYYRNGEIGTRIWRANKTLERESIRFPGGLERMWAQYAADGVQIINGHEVRMDGSTRWIATMDAQNTVTTTTYWYNGKVFSTEVRKLDKVRAERWFYFPSGAKWAHRIGTTSGTELTELEEIWFEDGNPQFAHHNGMSGASTDAHYRPDGTLAIKQVWDLRPRYWPGDTTPALQRRALLKVETYSADGTRLVREYVMASGGYYIDHVVDHNPDGTTTDHDMLYDGSVSTSVTKDADGKVVETKSYTARTTFRITMPSDLRVNYLDQLDPRKTWQDLEDHPEKRS